MPYAFDPDSAVLITSPPGVEIDEGSLALQAEEFLLTHKCQRSAQCQTERVMGQKVTRGGGGTYSIEAEPHCLLRVDWDQTLEFSIDATALALSGLANHHPGAGLDDYGLAFLNGAVSEEHPLPFRFTGGTWIYMDPSQDCAAGDLADISFKVVREFTDLIEGSGEVPPGELESYTLILRQNNGAILQPAVRTDALEDVFHGTFNFTGVFAATLYNGDPFLAGTAVSEVLTLEPWTEITAGFDTYACQLRNPNTIQWVADPLARTVTHVLYTRGATYLAARALDFPVSVPAGYGIRADNSALALEIRWPLGGQQPTHPDHWASAHVLKHVAGTASLPIGDFVVEAWDADPEVFGNVILDTFAAARVSTEWTVLGDLAQNTNVLPGFNSAPLAGWVIGYYAVRISALPDVRFIIKNLPDVVTAGGTISIPAAALQLDITP